MFGYFLPREERKLSLHNFGENVLALKAPHSKVTLPFIPTLGQRGISNMKPVFKNFSVVSIINLMAKVNMLHVQITFQNASIYSTLFHPDAALNPRDKLSRMW